MYQPHDMLWMLPVAVLFWMAAASTAVLPKRRFLDIPKWVPVTCALGFISCIIGLTLTREYDEFRERQQLRGLDASQVSRLTLSRAARMSEIRDTNSVDAVLAELKAVKNIPAHHTHSLDFVDVAFEYHRQQFLYHIGRDSERQNEYWIEAGGGRIQSATFGLLIDRLLGQAWQPPAQ